MHSARILIVEDEIFIAKDLKSRLEALGFAVAKIVGSGEAAIVEAAALLPDIVLVDIDIRGAISGERTIAELRRIDGLSVLPVISSTDLEFLSFDAPGGTFGAILKPFDDREIRATLETTIHRMRVDASLQELTAWHETLLREIDDPFVLLERQPDAASGSARLVIRKVNPAFASLAGRNQSELVGDRLESVFPGTEAVWQDLFVRTEVEHLTVHTTITVTRTGARMRVSAWRPAKGQCAVLVRHETPPVTVEELQHTDAGDTLTRTNRFLRNILDSSSTISIVSTDLKGMVEFWNSGAENLFGYSASDMVGKKSIAILYPSGDAQTAAAVAEIQRLVMGQKRTLSREMREVRKDGKRLWVRVTVSPRLNEEGEVVGLLGIGEDITPRKELEEAARDTKETLESILNELSDVVYSVSAIDGSLLHLNAAAQELYGLPLDALRRNPQFWLDAVHADDRPQLTGAVAELLASGVKEWTYRIVRPDGEVRWVYDRGRVVRDREGHPFRIDCLISDITHRKEAEDRLQASLHEKELLLKEIHHRVKNNLTTVSSLLSLQEQHSQGKAIGEILREAMSRIRSMGLIHERLYQSPRLAEIDAADYFRSLSVELVRLYGRGNVRLEINGDPFPLDIDSAIPCGLLITELLTNALKYAFPDGRSGVIRIVLTPLPPTGFELQVSDDGVGFPPGFDPASVDTLGLSLVQLLTSQLNGTMVFGPGPGVSARLTVKVMRKKHR